MVEQFCKSILQIVIQNSKALANLVMGLASSPSSRSVVELSLSPCYHYQYSSISKTIASLDKKVGIERKRDDEAGLNDQQERLSRLAVEKKFVLEGRLYTRAIGQLLFIKYGY